MLYSIFDKEHLIYVHYLVGSNYLIYFTLFIIISPFQMALVCKILKC